MTDSEQREAARQFANKWKIESYYRGKIRSYFADHTEEGRIDKYARMEEAESVMELFCGLTPERSKQIYEEEYWKSIGLR